MSLEEEMCIVAPRIPGGTIVPIGIYVNLRTMCYTIAAATGALPALDWWHKIGTASASSGWGALVNALLNGPASGLTPISGGLAYSYADSAFSAYTSNSTYLPTSKGQGAQDA